MSRAPNMEADATDPASPIVERELTARLMRWNSDVRGLPILFWPIYGLLDSGRSAWWLFLILAGLHVLCFALYLRLARSHAAGSDRESPEYWLHLHLVLTVANGLVAGVGAAVVAWSADISVRVVLCLLLIIFAFGASSRAYSARIYAGYVAALLMPMSVALMLTQQTIAMVLGLAALPILGAGMLLLARGQRRLAREMVSAALSHERLLHRLEAANTASEDARGTLRTALNALSDAVVLYGADKRLLFINDVALRTMGTDRAEELIGLTLKELVGRQIEAGEFGPLGPAERAAAIDLREQLLEHGTDGWHSLPRRDRWLEVSVSILAEGRRLVVHRDVTDLKNSETRATEARAKLVAAMESMAGGIAFFDAEERMELCNESFKWFMNNDPVICSPGVTLEDAHRRGALRLAPEIREKAVE
ncbi:MAG: PAS domain-containing protein, partial [Alphaproteobacteria bacterium]|nr:PAS domain-containing protein [Alphaproteobacteria bacterium]